MKKILIVAFYELKDYLLYIKELFEQYSFVVISYPLFRYAYDSHDKIDDYKSHMNNFIKDNNPDIILWWFIDVPIDVFKFIKSNNKDKMFIMYNSDDPLNLNKELFDKAKIFDIIITPCKETIHMYKLYSNVKNVLFGPMGYDPNLFKPITKNDDIINEYNQFSSDISILTYNLFLDNSYYPNQVVYKKDLIDNLIIYCQTNNLKIKLYGTPALKEFYPLQYSGEIPYYKLNFLYNFSKINIVTHPDKEKTLHVDEHIFSILGAGGLLMTDAVKDFDKFFKNNENCILYNSDDYIQKIDKIIKNYKEYVKLKINARIFSEKYSWDIWVENIVREIGLILFDKHVYSELYDLDINSDLKDRWLQQGIKNKEIVFNFDVPDNFDDENYIIKAKIKNNKRFAYFHWFMNSKDELFLKKKNKSTSNINLLDSHIVMEDYFNICTILNKISSYKTRDQGLIELNNYCKIIPYININDIVNNYVNSVL